MLELGELEGGERVMSLEQGVLYYLGTVRMWYLLCFMNKSKCRLGDEATCLCWPAVIKFISWQAGLV